MNLIEIIKDWAGVAVAIVAAIYGIIKYVHDFRNSKENIQQNKQHTKQEKITTEEKNLDLDHRRVKASEEIASESLEHLAETREENLKLLENNYELRKAVVDLQFEVKGMKGEIAELREQKLFLEISYCRKDCTDRDPAKGTFTLSCVSIDEIKRVLNAYGKKA